MPFDVVMALPANTPTGVAPRPQSTNPSPAPLCSFVPLVVKLRIPCSVLICALCAKNRKLSVPRRSQKWYKSSFFEKMDI
jgi:hypothetical protein